MFNGVRNRTIDAMTAELIRDFEAIAHLTPRQRKTGKGTLEGWQSLARQVAMELKQTYPDPAEDESDRTYTTALNQAKRLKANLRKFDRSLLLDEGNYHPVQTIVKNFSEALTFLFSEYQAKINSEYKRRVANRSGDESRIHVDIAPYVAKAQAILRDITEGATNKGLKWEDVSCALALVTGRRMSEIHFSAQFQPMEDYQIGFRGQLKGKSRTEGGEKLIDHQFTIPTLADPQDIVNGLKWLDTHGKRNAENPEQVNKKWGKELSRRVKSDWAIVSDEQWQAVDPKDKMTYHKLRGLYFISCLSLAGEKFTFSGLKRLAPQILCDGDITAIEPYERVDIEAETLKELMETTA